MAEPGRNIESTLSRPTYQPQDHYDEGTDSGNFVNDEKDVKIFAPKRPGQSIYCPLPWNVRLKRKIFDKIALPAYPSCNRDGAEMIVRIGLGKAFLHRR